MTYNEKCSCVACLMERRERAKTHFDPIIKNAGEPTPFFDAILTTHNPPLSLHNAHSPQLIGIQYRCSDANRLAAFGGDHQKSEKETQEKEYPRDTIERLTNENAGLIVELRDLRAQRRAMHVEHHDGMSKMQQENHILREKLAQVEKNFIGLGLENASLQKKLKFNDQCFKVGAVEGQKLCDQITALKTELNEANAAVKRWEKYANDRIKETIESHDKNHEETIKIIYDLREENRVLKQKLDVAQQFVLDFCHNIEPNK